MTGKVSIKLNDKHTHYRNSHTRKGQWLDAHPKAESERKEKQITVYRVLLNLFIGNGILDPLHLPKQIRERKSKAQSRVESSNRKSKTEKQSKMQGEMMITN